MTEPRPAGRSPIRRGELTFFLAIAFGFSWLPWLLAIASSRGWIAGRVPLTPFGSFGPAVAAGIVLAASRERGALRWWLASFGKWRMPFGTLAAAVLLPPAVAAAAFLAATAARGVWIAPKLPSPGFLLAASLEILILGGPLGEEPGWRGYMLARLVPSLGAVRATIAVAITWLAWHAPLFWVPGSAQREIPFLQFALAILAEGFLLTWIFESSGGSTLAAMLSHASFNATFLFASLGILEKGQARLFWPLYLGGIVLSAAAVGGFSWVFRARGR